MCCSRISEATKESTAGFGCAANDADPRATHAAINARAANCSSVAVIVPHLSAENSTQRVGDPHDNARVPRSITRQMRDRGTKFIAAHDGEQAFDGLLLQDLLSAHEEIVLGGQPYEVEIELPSGGLDAETDIGHAARDIGGDGRVREFDSLVAVDQGFIETELSEQPIEQAAGSGVRISIDETRLACRTGSEAR